MNQKIIIPVPFALSTYGINPADTYKEILGVKMANPIQSEVYSSNQFQQNCLIKPAIKFDTLPDTMPDIGGFIESAHTMQVNLSQTISSDFDSSNQYFIIGGDHTISVGTGLGLSKHLDMTKVGLIWVDAHGDCNTPETSQSKCITGYPVAVNTGLGPSILTDPFASNFIQHVAYIGIRDLDMKEAENIKKIGASIYSAIDIESIGIAQVVKQAMDSMKGCTHIWLSIDIDSLDSSYFEPGETDVPVSGGLNPRELLYITSTVQNSGKLLVTELTQLNNLGHFSPLVALGSRIGELALGLGGFRYGLK